ncbi:MAG: PqqD family protein [Rhodoglobus sp.]
MNRATRLAVNRPTVIYDVQGDETVIIDLATGHYFRLDAASTRLWERFDVATSPDELLAQCGNPGDLDAALDTVLTDLLDRNLLRVATEAEAAGLAGAAWAFEGFLLEEFTDLEDILGLDPIHEVDQERGWPHVPAP